MPTREQPTPAARSFPHGKQFSGTDQVRIKVEQDIMLLTDRIASLRCHPRPNTLLIETYEAMLNSRKEVLEWLLHGSDKSPEVALSRSA
jgi:hypothetical protein